MGKWSSLRLLVGNKKLHNTLTDKFITYIKILKKKSHSLTCAGHLLSVLLYSHSILYMERLDCMNCIHGLSCPQMSGWAWLMGCTNGQGLGKDGEKYCWAFVPSLHWRTQTQFLWDRKLFPHNYPAWGRVTALCLSPSGRGTVPHFC
jgi:hypothetical protein